MLMTMEESIKVARRRRQNKKYFKMCCTGITLILLVTMIIIVCLTLTVLKPKDPEISIQSFGFRKMQFTLYPNLTLNATLDMQVTVKNPNIGSFEYENTTTDINYHGDIVAKYSLGYRKVPAKGQVIHRTLMNVIGEKLVMNPYFMHDFGLGSFNFTSRSTRRGIVSVWNFIKFKGNIYTTCDISFITFGPKVISTCKSSLKV